MIESAINNKCVKTFTVASALSKMREHSYIGTKEFNDGDVDKLHIYNVLLVDEVSMITNKDMHLMVNYVVNHNKKMILIGDSNQIPSPSAPIVWNQAIDAYVKSDNYVFTDVAIPKYTLTEIIRQKRDSPMYCLSNYVSTHMHEPIDITKAGYDSSKIVHEYESFFTPKMKIITYTNQAVREHTMAVRKLLYYYSPTTMFVPGEILMGYNNVGWPVPVVINGQEYTVETVARIENYVTGAFEGLTGEEITVVDQHNPLFFLSVYEVANQPFLLKMVELAQRVNAHRSTKEDFSQYMKLKNKTLFLEDLFCFQDQIYSEEMFRDLHPMLFVNVKSHLEAFESGVQIAGPNLEDYYPGLIQSRLDDDKMVGDGELFSDQFKVIEKDMYYGYAITAHKAQGSTHEIVIADKRDFDKMDCRPQYHKGRPLNKLKEKNQLLYVLYSRASVDLFIYDP